MNGPASAVMAAVNAGARSVPEVASRTGLSVEMARLIVERLARLGCLSTQHLTSVCLTDGCAGCGLVKPKV